MKFDILVAGAANLATTLRVEGFPVDYAKVRFAPGRIADRVSGVGFNVAAGLARLGWSVGFAGALGPDPAGDLVEAGLRSAGVALDGLRRDLQATPRSAILRDPEGRGAIFSDLKNLQEYAWPPEAVRELVAEAGHVHATNVEWGLDFAREATRQGKKVSTDIQAVGSVDDAYNRRFLEVAAIVFLSGENLSVPPGEALGRIVGEFGANVAVCGMGASGALALERGAGEPLFAEAFRLGGGAGADSTGAGDAMAAGFLSLWLKGRPLGEALRGSQIAAAAWMKRN
jgi:sugar/nucleoside kinase (ribokinase family)